MTERDAMARLVAANPVPEPGPQQSAVSSRALFLERAVLARPRPARRVVGPRWLVPVGLVAVAVAAVAVVYTQQPVGVVSSPAPAPTVATPKTILYAAAERAERAVQRGQFVHVTGAVGRVVHMPSAGGYDLIRVDSVQSVQPADGLPGEGWVAIGEAGSSVRPLTDADAAAYAQDGSPGADKVPRVRDDQALHPNLADDNSVDGDVLELPDDPVEAGQAMVGWLTSAGLPAPSDPQGWLFREGAKLLDTFTDVVSGPERAKVFRVLAGLPGLRTLDAQADPHGRPALGLAYTQRTPRYGIVDWQVFLGPDTGQITYTQAVVREPGPANSTLRPGAVQYSTAVTSVTWSDKP